MLDLVILKAGVTDQWAREGKSLILEGLLCGWMSGTGEAFCPQVGNQPGTLYSGSYVLSLEPECISSLSMGTFPVCLQCILTP